jgi:hypothetical protein
MMKDIYEANPENRVGVVAFSNIGEDVLPIGRYSADDDKIFTYTENSLATGHTTLQLSESLKDGYKTDAGGTSESYYKGKSLTQTGIWDATFTQWGLQQAYEMFKTVKDTQVTLPQSKKTVTRQPIMILLTDGDPTFCTYNYMNPKAGPYYGAGFSNGIQGYYTILSANYFKNLTGIHYNKKVDFYTVGMGIKSSGYGNFYEEGAFDPNEFVPEVDHSYMRAVLDPTKENIEALSTYSKRWENATSDDYIAYYYYYYYHDYNVRYFRTLWQITGRELKELLTCKDSDGNDKDAGAMIGHTLYEPDDGYSGGYDAYEVTAKDPFEMLENRVPGVDNPYKDDYNYVDGAYFGQLTTEDLETIFEDILDKVQLKGRYDFLLKENSNLVVTDPLGDGMEVKGEPVLRYFGKNYDTVDSKTEKTENGVKYTEYRWKGTPTRKENSDAKNQAGDDTVDISGIVAKIATDVATGNQTVTLTVPEDILPVFYPDLYKQFYYEELPVRLIYKVGLTEAEETKLKETYTKNGYVEATYYTNKYDGNTASATATFTPADDDPYYENMDSPVSYQKVENTSGTSAYNFSESYDTSTGVVTQTLGNNATLNIVKDNTVTIDVEKVWNTENAEHPNSVAVHLFAKGTKTYADGTKTQFTSWLDSVTLSSSNNWKYSWEKIPREKQNDDVKYSFDVFYVTEEPMKSYVPTYKDKSGNALITETITTGETAVSDEAEEADESGDVKVVAMTATGKIETTDKPIPLSTTYDAVDANSGKVVITNTNAFKLPDSGGIGDQLFTMGAMASIVVALLMIIMNKRKKMIK